MGVWFPELECVKMKSKLYISVIALILLSGCITINYDVNIYETYETKEEKQCQRCSQCKECPSTVYTINFTANDTYNGSIWEFYVFNVTNITNYSYLESPWEPLYFYWRTYPALEEDNFIWVNMPMRRNGTNISI